MTVIYVIICLFLVILVLLQQGKGAGMGIISGGSDTILGSNAGNIFTKATSWMAAFFILGALVLSILSSGKKTKLDSERLISPSVTNTNTLGENVGMLKKSDNQELLNEPVKSQAKKQIDPTLSSN